MPKEAKKFINPLLRPSQPTEEKSEPVVERSKTVPLVRKPVRSEPESTLPVEEKTLPAEAEIESTSTTVQPHISESTSGQTQFDESSFFEEVDSAIQEDVAPSTFETVLSTQINEYVVEKEESGPTLVRESKSAKGDSAKSRVDSTKSLSNVPAVQNSSQRLLSRAPEIAGSDVISDVEVIYEDPQPSNGRAIKRRRSPLAFEKTHERVTVWIDKRLKQGFEDLAYQKELPKAALLNEAIADLLRKHGLE